jgi:predicted dehydrogenase
MTKRFRVGIIGTGMITTQSHLPAALTSPLVELTALVDPVVSRAQGLARSFGLRVTTARQLTDVLHLMDGAIIATPNSSHRDLAVQCLEAGVHVLVEKPLAVSAAEGEAIMAAAHSNQRVVALGYVTRFYPSAQLLERLLKEGYFGQVRRFHHQFGTAGGWAPKSGYILDRKSTGGGVLMVTGTHFLDRMLTLWGYPDEVTYRDDGRGGPEANCVAGFTFRRADQLIEGGFRYSKTARLPGGLVLETEAGKVIQLEGLKTPVVLRPNGAPHLEQVIQLRAAPQHAADPFVQQLENFVKACRGEEALASDGESGVQSLRLLERLYASRQPLEDQWYKLREVG